MKIASLVLALLLSTTATAFSANQASKFLVILDPGHGGSDTGAIAELNGKKIYEKDLTLAIAGATMRTLRARGIAVALTRGDDRFVTLDQRTKLANEAAAHAQGAVFVSIHNNSSDDHTTSGSEIYVFNATTNEASRRLADIENGKAPHVRGRRPALMAESHGTLDLILDDLATTANYTDSVRLACSIERSVHSTRDRGVRQALFYVLMESHVPGILFEPGFVSNPQDLARLSAPAYQKRLAASLADGITRWRRTQQASSSRTAVSGVAKRDRCNIIRD